MKSNLWRFVVLAFVVVFVSCSGKGKDESGKANTATASQTETPVAAGTPVAPSKADIKNLGALIDLIAAEADELPRAEFDPAALADLLGKDPQKIFEWVRDRTWWAPYRGLLRGAKGVMLDRVGSNLDRAVLLGDLMRRSGYTVRLAHAELPENRARELLGKVRPIPDQRRSPIAAKPVSAERQQEIEAIMPGLEKTVLEQIAASKRSSDEAGALARSQADQLYAMVRDVATRNATDDKEAIAALQDYWWVELEQDGNWNAMDVLLPDAKAGDALAIASATSEWNMADDAPPVPETNWHTVQIRVVVERYHDGTTTESTVLETVLRPMDVLERPIMLIHMPKPWPEVKPDPKADPNVLKNAALWVSEWVPILRIGEDYFVQSRFSDRGEVTNNAAGGGLLGGGGSMGSMGGALGGAEEAESYATAEWIDYEIRVPGASTQHLRRPVFDLLGPARRSARGAGFEANTDALKLERFEALWSPTVVLLQPCDFTGEFVAHLMSASLIANQAAIKELSRERDPAKAKDLVSKILERIDLWGPLPDLALWRAALGRQPTDWFIDRPNVLNYRVSQSVVSTDRVTPRELIDIASNTVGVRRGSGRSPFEVRLEQGVTDTVAEMLTLGSNLRMAENTASVFAMANVGFDRSVLVKRREAAAVREFDWPADVAARLSENIDSGFMVVALKQPVLLGERQRVGWWRVDPMSGETIGVMDTGFHAIMVDNAVTRVIVVLTAKLAVQGPAWNNVSQRWRDGAQVATSLARELRARAVAQQLINSLTQFAESMGWMT